MAIERARAFLKQFGKDHEILEFPLSSATVALAAQALGCEEARIAKTLSFDIAGRTILIVCAGDVRIDNAKYKAAFSAKAKMLSFEEVEERVGHAVGGVCPFGVREECEIYLDESLRRFDFVYPACGSSNSAIKLSVSELEAMLDGARRIDVCK